MAKTIDVGQHSYLTICRQMHYDFQASTHFATPTLYAVILSRPLHQRVVEICQSLPQTYVSFFQLLVPSRIKHLHSFTRIQHQLFPRVPGSTASVIPKGGAIVDEVILLYPRPCSSSPAALPSVPQWLLLSAIIFRNNFNPNPGFTPFADLNMYCDREWL